MRNKELISLYKEIGADLIIENQPVTRIKRVKTKDDESEKNSFDDVENLRKIKSIEGLKDYIEKFKLLDQPITLDLSKEICTNLSFFDFEKYTNAWFIEKNYKKAIDIIFSVSNKGYSVMDILDGYFTFIKITQMLNETQKYNIIKLICKYISLFHTLHEHDIELAFFTNELNKMIK